MERPRDSDKRTEPDVRLLVDRAPSRGVIVRLTGLHLGIQKCMKSLPSDRVGDEPKTIRPTFFLLNIVLICDRLNGNQSSDSSDANLAPPFKQDQPPISQSKKPRETTLYLPRKRGR